MCADVGADENQKSTSDVDPQALPTLIFETWPGAHVLG